MTRTTRQLRVALLCALPVALVMTPLGQVSSGVTLCLFKLLFHLECPGCGMTHAFAAVMHLRFSEAFAFNRGVVIVFPIVAWSAARQLFADVRELLRA